MYHPEPLLQHPPRPRHRSLQDLLLPHHAPRNKSRVCEICRQRLLLLPVMIAMKSMIKSTLLEVTNQASRFKSQDPEQEIVSSVSLRLHEGMIP